MYGQFMTIMIDFRIQRKNIVFLLHCKRLVLRNYY